MKRINTSIFLVVLLIFTIHSVARGECIKSGFILAIDVGHSERNGGATSATGVREYAFNKAVAEGLIKELKKEGHIKPYLLGDNSLKDRVAFANKRNTNLLLSLHHDSVQPRYLSKWTHRGRIHMYSDKYKGYSIFYSQKNGASRQSLHFANLLGLEMLKAGLAPSLHHVERIEGENRELIDGERGIYRYDDLIMLKGSIMPAVLLECGIIVNRQEEELLRDPAYRIKIVTAIRRAISTYCSVLHQWSGCDNLKLTNLKGK